MRLRDFQATLGKGLYEPSALDAKSRERSSEARASMDALLSSAGFAFTRCIQRSWCEGRVSLLAKRTLAALPLKQRHALIAAWVDRGGGRGAFAAEEAIAFLQFIADDLRGDPAALYWCRIEQAIYRAVLGREWFVPPAWPDHHAVLLGHAEHATLVTHPTGWPFIEPPLLFAPGLPNLVREALPVECMLWEKLTAARPAATFSNTPHLATLKTMLAEGALGLS